MSMNTYLIKWFYSFLTNRTQQVKVNRTLSDTKYYNTGVPQGCVVSPTLFTLYTNDCRTVHPNNYMVRFADDTVLLNLLHKDMDPSVYQDEIDLFIKWCDTNHLILNVKNQEITQVSSYKYLGVNIDHLLCWKTHIDNLCNRLQQRLYFLWRLRLYVVNSHIMMIFYRAIVASIIRYGIASWFGNLTICWHAGLQTGLHAQNSNENRREDRIQAYTEHYEKSNDNTFRLPTLFPEYETLPSGRRIRIPLCKCNRLKL